jgi:hypothetical protein
VKKIGSLGGLALGLIASSAHAHHGVAAVGLAEPEGPGAALETTAALPLPQRMAFALVKSELVSFQSRDRADFSQQKDFSSFNMLVLGYGITPWLSAYVFQPYNVKSADSGMGSNAGLGDTNLMLAFGWKWDEGLRLIPQKESLDELADWHFLLWASCTLPVGPTERNDGNGKRFAPDMQTGFGKPSPAMGLSALKQLSINLTMLGEVNHQRFFTHSYSFTRYRFGAETRLNVAGVYRIFGRGKVRLDGVAELGGLNLQRDKADDGEGLVGSRASGGTILYGGVGARLYLGRVGVALGARRALAKFLNEASEQQGSEGLENIRVFIAISVANPI